MIPAPLRSLFSEVLRHLEVVLEGWELLTGVSLHCNEWMKHWVSKALRAISGLVLIA